MQKPVLQNGLAFLFFIFSFTSCQHYDPNAQNRQKAKQTETIQPVKSVIQEFAKSAGQQFEPGLPVSKSKNQVVKHFAYTLSYNEEHELPDWVAYTLKASYLRGNEKRSDDFREDAAVKTISAEPEDYRKSGYDRGHLVPAADMKWSRKAMSETFLLSNITPQNHAFNAGIWEKLESSIRNWAKKDTILYIVTGPVLQGEIKSIGKNKVTVPPYFYKAVLDPQQPEIKAIAFVIPNKPVKQSYRDFAISIDSLEKIIDMDLFPGLPDEIENEAEKNFSVKAWKSLPSKPKNTRRK